MTTTKTTSTRELILRLLKKKGKLTVAEFAEELQITEMAVRRHLNTLERDQIVETTLLRQAMGRPTNIYQLTKSGQETFPRDYAPLALDILNDIQTMYGEDMLEELFQRRKERLSKRYMKRLHHLSFEERIEEFMNIQNELGYMAEYDLDEDGRYWFKQYNCPISRVSQHFTSICQYEQSMLQEILEAEHVSCMMCASNGQDGYCCYKIEK
ncbi:helix-turn-helix transcriptional regulator [Texcoconibacillus texcoconensis]|nr:DeoR family transcriptional regulator [Texcoconibacillus texcoconensis]